ncbi:NAD(P)-binding protein [Gymnopus androsaceus JB14]|uniref:NAD(P)-binding protein n=1 Tax=Gymnopus androsaceus JB14 TaxID=1447944 RepID=A0A6A4I9T2_9AGAR|nr:NAD(P)-binding protein [Gymnopus androsaceus JB14]
MGILNSKPQWQVSSIPDLTGRVAIVTGGNTGLGFVTVRELARKGAHVYMLCRQESRALAAIEKIKSELGPDTKSKIEFIKFDLQNLKSATKAAQDFMERETRLDILVNNAGIMATPYELSADGIEAQACNGTGHFALTIPLLPLLKQTAALPDSHVRIVNITSMGYQFARLGSPDFSSLEGLNQKTRSAWVRYGFSKLSNILFTNELQTRLIESGTTNIYCLSVHPGSVNTELVRGPIQSWPILAPLFSLAKYIALTPEQGALTQLYAATAPEVEEKDLKAALLFPIAQLTRKKAIAEDKERKLGIQFWNLCEALVREKA